MLSAVDKFEARDGSQSRHSNPIQRTCDFHRDRTQPLVFLEQHFRPRHQASCLHGADILKLFFFQLQQIRSHHTKEKVKDISKLHEC